jgi:hypothetical protein
MGDKYHHSVTSCHLSSRRGFPYGSHRGELSTKLTEGWQPQNIRAVDDRPYYVIQI